MTAGLKPSTNAQPARAPAPAPKTARSRQATPAPMQGGPQSLVVDIAELPRLELAGLRLCWRNHLGGTFPTHLPKWLLTRVLAYRLQAAVFGDLDAATLRRLRGSSSDADTAATPKFVPRAAATRDGAELRPGALLVREWKGQLVRVMVLDQGFAWNGEAYSSLSQVARAITGVSWNGHRFFGLKKAGRSEPGRAGHAE
jgi:hypothetical protein